MSSVLYQYIPGDTRCFTQATPEYVVPKSIPIFKEASIFKGALACLPPPLLCWAHISAMTVFQSLVPSGATKN